jgi:integrase
MIIRFTQSVLDEAKAEGLARVELWDTDAKGLGLRVSASGRKLFCYRYFFSGKNHRITMGDYPTMSLSEARGQALRWRGSLLEGNPPHLTRSTLKEDITFKDFTELFINRFAAVKLRESTLKGYIYCIKKVLVPAFGPQPVAAITAEQVEGVHAALSQTPRLANLCLSVLSKMMVLSIRWGYRARQDNPASFIMRYEEGKRDRHLAGEEIKRLFDYLDSAEDLGIETPWVCAAVRLALLTGMRRGELLSLTWDQVDLEEGIILLPKHKTSRSAGNRTVALSGVAVEVLRALPKMKANKRVFPGSRPDTTAAVPEAWLRIRSEVALNDVHFHDLRHTFATEASSANHATHHVGYAMGQSDTKSFQRYQHGTTKMLRDVAESVSKRAQRAQKKGA